MSICLTPRCLICFMFPVFLSVTIADQCCFISWMQLGDWSLFTGKKLKFQAMQIWIHLVNDIMAAEERMATCKGMHDTFYIIWATWIPYTARTLPDLQPTNIEPPYRWSKNLMECFFLLLFLVSVLNLSLQALSPCPLTNPFFLLPLGLYLLTPPCVQNVVCGLHSFNSTWIGLEQYNDVIVYLF